MFVDSAINQRILLYSASRVGSTRRQNGPHFIAIAIAIAIAHWQIVNGFSICCQYVDPHLAERRSAHIPPFRMWRSGWTASVLGKATREGGRPRVVHAKLY